MAQAMWMLSVVIGFGLVPAVRLAHGRFWRADQRLGVGAGRLTHGPRWPCVIPARDEAATIAEVVRSAQGQRDLSWYGCTLIVADDGSSEDGTGALAREAGAEVVTAPSLLEPGWSGKLWALRQRAGRMRRKWHPGAGMGAADGRGYPPCSRAL